MGEVLGLGVTHSPLFPQPAENMAFMLTELGYQVVEAADGEIALRRCHDNAQKIDLVIADILMPNMTGK